MKYYVVLNRDTLTQYGVTNKLWLVRLFIIQRREYNRNLILREKKGNDITKEMLMQDPTYIHYFSSCASALTNAELELLDYILLTHGHAHEDELSFYHKKFRDSKKKLKKLQIYEKVVIPQMIEDLVEKIISQHGDIMQYQQEKNFFENILSEV